VIWFYGIDHVDSVENSFSHRTLDTMGYAQQRIEQAIAVTVSLMKGLLQRGIANKASRFNIK
jgi:hypothetical protein